jgi:hypothetical protein
MQHHSERLARMRVLIDEVEAQQRAGRAIAAKIEELRREITRTIAPADSNDEQRKRRQPVAKRDT